MIRMIIRKRFERVFKRAFERVFKRAIEWVFERVLKRVFERAFGNHSRKNIRTNIQKNIQSSIRKNIKHNIRQKIQRLENYSPWFLAENVDPWMNQIIWNPICKHDIGQLEKNWYMRISVTAEDHSFTLKTNFVDGILLWFSKGGKRQHLPFSHS